MQKNTPVGGAMKESAIKKLWLFHLSSCLTELGRGHTRGGKENAVEGALIAESAFKGNIAYAFFGGEQKALSHGDAEGIDQKTEIATEGGGNYLGNVPFAVALFFGKTLKGNILRVVIVEIDHKVLQKVSVAAALSQIHAQKDLSQHSSDIAQKDRLVSGIVLMGKKTAQSLEDLTQKGLLFSAMQNRRFRLKMGQLLLVRGEKGAVGNDHDSLRRGGGDAVNQIGKGNVNIVFPQVIFLSRDGKVQNTLGNEPDLHLLMKSCGIFHIGGQVQERNGGTSQFVFWKHGTHSAIFHWFFCVFVYLL